MNASCRSLDHRAVANPIVPRRRPRRIGVTRGSSVVKTGPIHTMAQTSSLFPPDRGTRRVLSVVGRLYCALLS
jgi:hypothetical protein